VPGSIRLLYLLISYVNSQLLALLFLALCICILCLQLNFSRAFRASESGPDYSSRLMDLAELHADLHFDNIKYDTDGKPIKEYIVFLVPFEEALDLVKNRKVYLENGFAFVPKEFLPSIITPRFRSYLSRQLAQMARYWSVHRQDERVTPLLKAFQLHQHSLNRWTTTTASRSLSLQGNLSYQQIPRVSQ
jgi:hypothetical protein